jgi:hypothetical protein
MIKRCVAVRRGASWSVRGGARCDAAVLPSFAAAFFSLRRDLLAGGGTIGELVTAFAGETHQSVELASGIETGVFDLVEQCDSELVGAPQIAVNRRDRIT